MHQQTLVKIVKDRKIYSYCLGRKNIVLMGGGGSKGRVEGDIGRAIYKYLFNAVKVFHVPDLLGQLEESTFHLIFIVDVRINIYILEFFGATRL